MPPSSASSDPASAGPREKASPAEERKARRFWVSFIVMLMCIPVITGGSAIYLSKTRSLISVIPDYYQASLHWDETQQERSAAERLGWTVKLQPAEIADGQGMRALELWVHDAQENPVDDLQIEGHFFRHRDANGRLPVQLRGVGEGHYLALEPMRETGIWQFELTIDGAPEPMAVSSTMNVQ